MLSSYGYSKPAFIIMDTKEAKEALTPMQELRQDVRELKTGYDWLKAFHRNVLTYLALLAGFVWFLLSRLESRLDSRIDKLDSRIDRIEAKLDLLIQKQAGQETSRQDTKQSPAKRQAKR